MDRRSPGTAATGTGAIPHAWRKGGHEEVKNYIDSLVGTAERAKYNEKIRGSGAKTKTHYDKLLLKNLCAKGSSKTTKPPSEQGF